MSNLSWNNLELKGLCGSGLCVTEMRILLTLENGHTDSRKQYCLSQLEIAWNILLGFHFKVFRMYSIHLACNHCKCGHKQKSIWLQRLWPWISVHFLGALWLVKMLIRMKIILQRGNVCINVCPVLYMYMYIYTHIFICINDY